MLVQLKLAFLDEEEAYLEQLRGYLVRQKERFFEVWTFTDAESLFKKTDDGMLFHAIVMTAPFWEAAQGRAKGIKKILLCEGREEESFFDCTYVDKYQSIERLLGRLLELLSQEKGGEEGVSPKGAANLIGIYSPVHHESQMLFGITLTQILAEEQKTLYVNLMGHSGFFGITDTSAKEDVGDLLYGMERKGFDFAAGLHKVRRSYRNFDYIPPVINPEHLSELSGEQMESFLKKLKSRSGYDCVVIDFGMVFPGFSRLLQSLSCFYCIGKEGTVNQHRMEEFLLYLEKEEEYKTVNMKQTLLPREISFGPSFLREGADPVAGSIYGRMGDYIRSSLYGGTAVVQ